MPTSLLLGVLLALVTAASAQDAPGAVDARQSPEMELRAAREAYVLGEREEAREQFLALVQRAHNVRDVPAELEARAWVYLGEMQLFGGDRRAADASFRLALERAPELRLSPVEHPETVIGALEVVRATVIARGDASPPRPEPLPWWGYAPFGVPQFKQQRHGRGAVYATLQVGFAAASVAAWFVVDDAVRRIDTRPPGTEVDPLVAGEQARDRAVLLRNAFSLSTAGAFYLTWIVSVTDGAVSWRRDQFVPSRVAVLPTGDGAQVSLSWRF